jgi:hypothetical protein
MPLASAMQGGGQQQSGQELQRELCKLASAFLSLLLLQAGPPSQGTLPSISCLFLFLVRNDLLRRSSHLLALHPPPCIVESCSAPLRTLKPSGSSPRPHCVPWKVSGSRIHLKHVTCPQCSPRPSILQGPESLLPWAPADSFNSFRGRGMAERNQESGAELSQWCSQLRNFVRGCGGWGFPKSFLFIVLTCLLSGQVQCACFRAHSGDANG